MYYREKKTRRERPESAPRLRLKTLLPILKQQKNQVETLLWSKGTKLFIQKRAQCRKNPKGWVASDPYRFVLLQNAPTKKPMITHI